MNKKKRAVTLSAKITEVNPLQDQTEKITFYYNIQYLLAYC